MCFLNLSLQKQVYARYIILYLNLFSYLLSRHVDFVCWPPPSHVATRHGICHNCHKWHLCKKFWAKVNFSRTKMKMTVSVKMLILFVDLLLLTLLLKINGSLAQCTHTDRFHSTKKTRLGEKTAKHAVYQIWCFRINGCHKDFQICSLTANFNFTAYTWYKVIHTNYNPKLQSIR